MTDHDALVRAVCDYPDDDTPRLVFADYLDEAGEADRAAFVRAQVEVARLPAWEPFAAECRHRKAGWAAGDPFRAALPAFPPGWAVGWHDRPFRRGFGWAAVVGSLHAWDEVAPWLFAHAPVGELHLRAPATLDDWRRFAAADRVGRLRAVHFEAGSPVEPLRALCASPHATGITDLNFHIATSPGLPTLVDDLLTTPLGRGLRRLSFRLGEWAWLNELLAILANGAGAFTELRLEAMGLTPDLVRDWCGRGGPARLESLDLKGNYALGNDGARALADGLRDADPRLHTLGLSGLRMTHAGAKAVAGCRGLAGVRVLDLSNNSILAPAARALAASDPLAGVRVLRLVGCQIGDRAVRHLTRARFWPTIVELDLSDNPISDPGAGHLLAADLPPDLTAILLNGRRLGGDTRTKLRKRFGERVILAT